MVNLKRIKVNITRFAYKYIERWYVKLSNKLNFNLTPITNSYEYTVRQPYETCNYSIYNPVECVYFALKKVYKRLPSIRVNGIEVDFEDEEKIIVTIHTVRPGIIIGLRGKDIDRLSKVLTRYFGKETHITLAETKNPYFTLSTL